MDSKKRPKVYYNLITLAARSRGILWVLLFVFVSGIFILQAFALTTSDPNCELFTIKPNCDLSGWMKFFLGDIAIGAFLAILLHTLNHRNTVRIDKILQAQEALNFRRKDYAVEHLKSMLNLVLYAMSMMRGSINHYNTARILKDIESQKWILQTTLTQLRGEEGKLGRLLQNVRTILVASNDVLEPTAVNRIWGVCNYIAGLDVQEKADGTMDFPKYNVCRLKLNYLLQYLQAYSQANHSFSEIEEPYESSAISAEASEVQEVKPQ